MAYTINEETLAEFPSKLKDARAFSGHSQFETALRIGVSSRTIYMWESRVSTIHPLKRYAAASFIRSTGVLVVEAIVANAIDPKEYFIGRLATGPALNHEELAAAIHFEIPEVYDDITAATLTRMDGNVPLSSADLSLLVQSVASHAQRNPIS